VLGPSRLPHEIVAHWPYFHIYVAESLSQLCLGIDSLMPGAPVDAFFHSRVRSIEVLSVQVGGKTRVEPPTRFVIHATVTLPVIVVIPVESGEGLPVVIVTFSETRTHFIAQIQSTLIS